MTTAFFFRNHDRAATVVDDYFCSQNLSFGKINVPPVFDEAVGWTVTLSNGAVSCFPETARIVVFVHDPDRSRWRRLAEHSNQIHVVFISSVQLNPLSNKKKNEHVCGFVTSDLATEPRIARFFAGHRDSDWQPEWELLLPAPLADSLVAARLILAAPAKIELEKFLPPDFWEFLDKAKKEWAKSAKQSDLCEAAILRGRLKHSWLENQVLNKAPDSVVKLRRMADWPELQKFPGNVALARSLADEVELGFSPARLVEGCTTLAVLSDAQRKSVQDALHAAYLKDFDAEGRAEGLRNAANAIAAPLTAFLEEWNKPNEAISDEALLSGWKDVLEAAEPLRAALDALPKGIRWP